MNKRQKAERYFKIVATIMIGLVLLATLATFPITKGSHSYGISLFIFFGVPEIFLIYNLLTEKKRFQAANDRKAAIITEDYKLKIEEAENKATVIIEEAEINAKNIEENYKTQANLWEAKINQLKSEQEKLNSNIKELEFDYKYQISNFSVDEEITSEEYKNKFSILTLEEKELSKSDKDIIIIDDSINKKLQNNDIKQIARCFNNETAVIISEVTTKNIENKRTKLMRSFETLNKLFKTDGVAISKEYLELKLKMLNIKYAQEYQKEQERLQQKAIREQMVEEEKVRREIEREKSKIAKEETQFKNEISKLMSYMQKSSDVEKQLYVDKIKELEDKLKQLESDKENVLNREQNTRAGFVYIISNIGSFGENVYKIGMTRRLEPMDRISELSSASVPFEFDVHAMIFSEDAPTLETTLHNIFADNRVNKVNPRKEFYDVSLDKIERAVKENFNATVTFTKVATAYQYRESLRIANNNNKKPSLMSTQGVLKNQMTERINNMKKEKMQEIVQQESEQQSKRNIQGNEPNDGDDECEISLPNIVTKSNRKHQSVSDSDNNKKQEKNSEEFMNSCSHSSVEAVLNTENIYNNKKNLDDSEEEEEKKKEEDYDYDYEYEYEYE